MKGLLRTAGRSLAAVLFPPRCVVCYATRIAIGTRLCPGCAAALDDERSAPACPRCARSVAPHEVRDGRCGRCRATPKRTAGAVRVGPYGQLLRRLVQAYKYRGREELEPLLADWLAEAVRQAPWFDRIDAMTAVPTHWRHRIRRPLHAAEALGARVAPLTGVPFVRLLRRVRGGPHQVGLSYTRRVANVRGAFALRTGVVLDAPRLLLIDDVQTTGATIHECAGVLRRGGAAQVYVATVVNVGWTLGAAPETLEAI